MNARKFPVKDFELPGSSLTESQRVDLVLDAMRSRRREFHIPDEHMDDALDILCSLTGERRQQITDDVRMDQLCDAAQRIAAIARIGAA